MESYKKLLQDVMANGVERPDRTGIGSKFITGAMIKHNLSDGFPAITIRKVPFRIAFEETMFFLRGQTDTKILEDKNINIWKGNTSREFLDSKNLDFLPEGSIGTGYSHQWRNFNGDLNDGKGVDQIVNLLEGLKKDPTSRRHVVSAWNPSQLDGTPLPPCHITQMYTVDPVNNLLHSSFVMRSNDLAYGLPFNLMGYSFLNHLFSKYLGLTPGTITYFGHDAHIYTNQYDLVNEIVKRDCKVLPSLKINKEITCIEDVFSVQYSDIELLNYKPHPDIKGKPGMAI